jgi:hypothetical protein
MVDPARLRRTALVAAVVILGATACSSSSGDATSAAGKPEVATLRSADPVASPASSSAAAQAPRERLDDTEADWQALIKPYDDCMKRHGLGAKGARLDGTMPSKAVTDAANKECQPMYPLPPWELDPANPEAKDFARDVVKCLKAKGVKYVEVNADGPGWSFGGPQNDAKSISKGMELSPACEREVAAKK